MSPPLFHVDAFAGEPFVGNPAAVCLLEREASASWMQAVAREMNLSETAFVCARGEHFGLRWFTPEVEVDLCGHATLASAHILWESGRADRARTLRFETRSGILGAKVVGDWIELDFPVDPPSSGPPPEDLEQALGIEAVWSGRGRDYHLVEVASEEDLRGLRPDFQALEKATPAVCVTAPADLDEYDFVSRFFAPGFGIDEDPVTGSAHCLLGPYWAQRFGRRELIGYQASARGGVVRLEVVGERVLIRGQAVTVAQGTLLPGP
jgi:PhzF family phenazine biosynthesis protein